MKLSKREQHLVYFLFCFLIIFGIGFAFVLPSMNKSNELESQYQTALTQKNQLETALLEYGDLDNAIQQVTKQITNVKSKFHEVIPNEDVDELLTNKVMRYGLTPISMDIVAIHEESLPSYQQTLLKSEEQTPETYPMTNMIQVTMYVSGTTSNIALLTEDIKAMDATHVNSLSCNFENTEQPIQIMFTMYVMK